MTNRTNRPTLQYQQRDICHLIPIQLLHHTLIILAQSGYLSLSRVGVKQGRAVLYVIVQSIIRLRIRTWSGQEGKQGIGSYTYRTCRTHLKSTHTGNVYFLLTSA